MTLTALVEELSQKKQVVTLVGGGGKTTLMEELARRCANRGKKVLVTTTTHIFRPFERYTADFQGVRTLWNRGTYAVIGTPAEHGKLTAPPKELYDQCCSAADVVLVEGDGSKHHPCKVPAPHEPVISEDCTLVIGVMGMTALGQPMKDCCFRFENCGGWLRLPPNAVMDEETACRILRDPRGTRKNVEARRYLAVLNQCDGGALLSRGQAIAKELEREGIPAVCTCFPFRK